MSFGYENIRPRKHSELPNGDNNDIELQVLIPNSVNEGKTHETLVGMELDSRASDAESSASEVDLYSKEEDKRNLIADEKSEKSDGIDQDGVVREYEVALEHIGFGLFHIILVICNGLALSSDAVEVLSISFVLPILHRPDELNIVHYWQTAVLSSVIFVGMLFGAYFWGGLADVVGRKRTLVMSLGVSGVFGLVSAFSPNYALFVVLRFCSGFGVGGSLPVLFPYISEFIRNKYRGPYMGIQSIFWMLGRLLCGAMAWIIIPQTGIDFSMGLFRFHSWRLFLVISAFPSLLGVFLYWFLPESPRYLLEAGKEKEAIKVLKLVHRLNHLRQKNAVYPVKSIRLEKADSSNVLKGKNVLAKTKLIFQRSVELFNRKLLIRTLLLLVIMFCLSFGSYGVTLWYPTYVGVINDAKDKENFENFCFKNVTDINGTSLPEYCGCNGTVFHDLFISNIMLERWTLTDAVLDNVTFERVNFSEVSFTNTDFLSGSTFINCNFHHSQILNSFFDKVTLDLLCLSDSRLCGTTGANINFRHIVTISNSSINNENISSSIVVQERNSSFLIDLLDINNVNTSNDSCATGKVKEWPIQCVEKQDDFRVYRDSFFVSASGLPGNFVSAIAVYFFTRKYWLAFSLVLSAVSVFLLYLVHSEVVVVVMLCLFVAISTPSWNDSSLIIAEVYPTHLRTTASGIHSIANRIGAIVGTNIFGEFVYVNPSIPILIVVVILLIAAVAALPLPKTTRKTLLK